MCDNSPSAKMYSFEDMLNNYGFVIYTCLGISMMPFLRQRKDIVEIRPLKRRAQKHEVVLYKRGDEYILHRVLKVRPQDYVICGDHNIWREYGVTDEQILGVMTRVIRNGKSITPNNRWYKLYVHFWCDLYHVRAAILVTTAVFRALIDRINGRRQENDVRNEE